MTTRINVTIIASILLVVLSSCDADAENDRGNVYEMMDEFMGRPFVEFLGLGWSSRLSSEVNKCESWSGAGKWATIKDIHTCRIAASIIKHSEKLGYEFKPRDGIQECKHAGNKQGEEDCDKFPTGCFYHRDSNTVYWNPTQTNVLCAKKVPTFYTRENGPQNYVPKGCICQNHWL